MSLADRDQEQLRILLRETVVVAHSLTVQLQGPPAALVGVMSTVRSLQRLTRRIADMNVSFDDAADLAVDITINGQVRLHDLNSYRAPDSPEGLT